MDLAPCEVHSDQIRKSGDSLVRIYSSVAEDLLSHKDCQGIASITSCDRVLAFSEVYVKKEVLARCCLLCTHEYAVENP